MFFIISVVFVFMALILYEYVSRLVFTFWERRHVVGPRPHLLFGNYLQLALNKKYSGTINAEVYQKFASEKVVGIYRFMTPVLMIRDLDLVKRILIKDFHYFQHRGIEFSKTGLGVNLFHSDGDTWNALHKKLTPLFTTSKIRGMSSIVNDRAVKFIQYIDTLVDNGDVLEINKLTDKYTADIIGTCGYGIDIDVFNDKRNQYLDIGRKQFSPTWRFFLDLLVPGILQKSNIDLFTADVFSHYEKVVKSVMQQRRQKPKLRQDLINTLIEMKEQGNIKINKMRSDSEINLEITDNLLIAQAFIFFGAGFDTSSTLLSMTLYELSLHQDVQDNLVQEIERVLQTQGENVTYDAINEMNYLTKVFSEALRKYPVIDLTRKAVHDYRIPECNLTIPEGTHIVVPLLGIHYDPELFPDPKRFDPERFSPENIKTRQPSAWMPFGLGRREYIGLRLAGLAVKSCLVHFLRRFRVAPPPGRRPQPLRYVPVSFTLAVQGGVHLSITRR